MTSFVREGRFGYRRNRSGHAQPDRRVAAIVRKARQGKVALLASVPLVMEYEAVCARPEHQLAAGLSEQEARTFVDGVIAIAEAVKIHYLWRPQLRDPSDEIVLEAAVNGRATCWFPLTCETTGRHRQDWGSK